MLHVAFNEFAALLQVVMIDLVLAGDNAIVIGLPLQVCRCSNAPKQFWQASSLQQSC